jgi:hypothetical protein
MSVRWLWPAPRAIDAAREYEVVARDSGVSLAAKLEVA